MQDKLVRDHQTLNPPTLPVRLLLSLTPPTSLHPPKPLLRSFPVMPSSRSVISVKTLLSLSSVPLPSHLLNPFKELVRSSPVLQPLLRVNPVKLQLRRFLLSRSVKRGKGLGPSSTPNLFQTQQG